LKWLDGCSDKESYYVLINKSGRTIKQGQEVFYTYHDLPNRWLLFNYSFAFKDNKYDNIKVDLVEEPTSRKVEDLICFDQDKAGAGESVYLQNNRLDSELLNQLRHTLKKFANESDITTSPSDFA